MIAQYIIVGIVVVSAMVFIVRKFVLTFTKKGCASSGCGCAVAEIEQAKH